MTPEIALNWVALPAPFGPISPVMPPACTLVSRLAVVDLIAATTTKTGLRVESALDERTYMKGIKVSKAEFARLDITGDPFHPEWNHTIRPRQSPHS